MILTVLSSESLSWLVWTLISIVVAMLGGILVFKGLWLEKSAEKEMHPDVFSEGERGRRLKGKRGWKYLMWGIALEILVAGFFAAKESWEIRQIQGNEARIDPRNIPISRISGNAFVVVRPPFKDFAKNLNLHFIGNNAVGYLWDENDRRKGSVAPFRFGISSSDDFSSQIPRLGAVQSMGQFDPTSVTNVGNIRLDFELAPEELAWNPRGITYNQLKYVEFSLMGQLPATPLEVVTGRVDVLISGFLPKTFLIPSQTNRANFLVKVQGK